MIPPVSASPGSAFTMTPAGSTDSSASTAGGPSFSALLGQQFQQVNQLQNSAGAQAEAFALGRSNDIHSTVIAGQKATIALDLATQIRNKVLDAYEEVMKTSM